MRRYRQIHAIASPLDPFSDVLVLMEYLTVQDYLTDLLISKHGLTKKEAPSRAQQIRPHVRAATGLICQTLSSAPELSFLPAYYGILNLLKVYILVGTFHDQLPTNRWHGATYPVGAKDSRNLLTEQIVLRRYGAIPLFYRTVTGTQMRPPKLALSDILPFVSGIGAEYHLATGKESGVRILQIAQEKLGSGEYQTQVHLRPLQGEQAVYSPKDFKVLRHFSQHPEAPNVFVGKTFSRKLKEDDSLFRKQFRSELIYFYPYVDGELATPLSSKHTLWPEELAIALLFFYMSSVVRYKPDFLARIRDSRYWPILATARQHSLLRMLILCWSHVHQENLILLHG
jgi:hypothetical protein